MRKSVPSLHGRMREFAAFVQRLHDYENRPKRPIIKDREAMTEREFIRFFGTKVVYSRLSRRADFVGLLIRGHNSGFYIVMGDDGKRRLVPVMIVDGTAIPAKNPIVLQHKDSASNMARGLLNFVQ